MFCPNVPPVLFYRPCTAFAIKRLCAQLRFAWLDAWTIVRFHHASHMSMQTTGQPALNMLSQWLAYLSSSWNWLAVNRCHCYYYFSFADWPDWGWTKQDICNRPGAKAHLRILCTKMFWSYPFLTYRGHFPGGFSPRAQNTIPEWTQKWELAVGSIFYGTGSVADFPEKLDGFCSGFWRGFRADFFSPPSLPKKSTSNPRCPKCQSPRRFGNSFPMVSLGARPWYALLLLDASMSMPTHQDL